ncbi:ATP-dependent nuclease [Hymenobacter norwichensis]|uniref:ATP-dependent nuclease n=1 Tax=Hymenobacter norwichensis TaxID=223903 RepID=UPI0003B53073|nr:AAA family ATPase [Hymenobacter norwichensis]
MKLESFRVFNYKSIIDSKECYLSIDNITILAGQNEAGKSSILEALRDYENNNYNIDSMRYENGEPQNPRVICKYSANKNEIQTVFVKEFASKDLKKLYSSVPLLINDKNFINTLRSVNTFSIEKIFNENSHEITLVGESYETIKSYIETLLNSENNELSEALLKEASNVNSVNNTTVNNEEITEDLDEEPLNPEEIKLNAPPKIELPTLEKFMSEIANILWRNTPYLIFFSDFVSVLPEQIFVSDLDKKEGIDGIQAVHNIESFLGTNFKNFSKQADFQVEASEETFELKLSKDFNSKWKQRIGDSKGVTISVKYYQGGSDKQPYLKFYIQTKRGEKLSPQRRSQGFRWFLSFYIQLNTSNDNKGKIILLDEPGLHLHSRAQSDMLDLLESLSIDNQIIYSTHSPYLIPTKKLHRARLIFNTAQNGTTIEKITTKISPQQLDALKPIIDAIGMDVAHDFSLVKKKNVVLEGISDFYYMNVIRNFYPISEEISFIPSMGSPNMKLLISLCIGWGLEWSAIFDEKGSSSDVNAIKKSLGEGEDFYKKKLFIIEGCDGIEDMFEESDFKLVNNIFDSNNGKISEHVKHFGGKELFARLFLSKVEIGEIKLSDLSKKAKGHMKTISEFIMNSFS